MFPRIILILCLTTTQITGLKLSGLCPVVPPTHFYNNSEVLFPPKIILSVPFTQNNSSLLFRNIPLNAASHWRILLNTIKGPVETQTAIELFYRNWPTKSRTIGLMDEERGDISVKSVIYDHKRFEVSKCHGQVKESSWMWLEDEVMIIWSCRDSSVSYEHDEAAIFINMPTAEEVDEPLEVIDERIKRVAKKYIGTALVDKLQ